MWKIFAFVKILPGFKPTAGGLRKMLLVLFIIGVGVGSFFWGRLVASQAPRRTEILDPAHLMPAQGRNFPEGVVAYLKGNIPITRQEFGEYLIARLGKDRIEPMINHRIVDLACRERGIVVSEAEVQAQFEDDLKALGATNITEKEFVASILKRFNKSLFEWKEDVIKPRLMMNKLVRSEVTVDQSDIDKAYETRYGPKVDCRMIVMRSGPDASLLWGKIHKEVIKGEAEFAAAAKDPTIQIIDVLREKEGKVPAVHKNFGDQNVERWAFSLQPGQVSVPIGMPDGTGVIIKCDKQIPAEANRPPLDERLRSTLYQEVLQLKINQRIPEKLQQLRFEYAPRVLLTTPTRPFTPDQVALQNTPANASEPPMELAPPPASALAKPETPASLPTATPPAPPSQRVDLVPPPTGSVPNAPADKETTKAPDSMQSVLPPSLTQIPGSSTNSSRSPGEVNTPSVLPPLVLPGVPDSSPKRQGPP